MERTLLKESNVFVLEYGARRGELQRERVECVYV